MAISEQIMGETTTINKASSKFESVRTTVPRSVVKQWGLKEGDKLEWIWKVIDGNLSLVISKVGSVSDSDDKLKDIAEDYVHKKLTGGIIKRGRRKK